MTHNNTPARRQGTQLTGIQERKVLGGEAEIARAVAVLTQQGLFISASPLAYDPQHGSYAIVRYRDPASPPGHTLVVRALPQPATAPLRAPARRAWIRPASVAALALIVILVLIQLVLHVLGQLGNAIASPQGKTFIGFAVIAGTVAFVAWIRRGKAAGGSGGDSGMGWHFGPCKK